MTNVPRRADGQATCPTAPAQNPKARAANGFPPPALPLYFGWRSCWPPILLPALIFSIVSAYTGYRDNQARTRESIVRFSELAATRTQLLIDSTRRLLITLSTTDLLEEAHADAALCGRRLSFAIQSLRRISRICR